MSNLVSDVIDGTSDPRPRSSRPHIRLTSISLQALRQAPRHPHPPDGRPPHLRRLHPRPPRRPSPLPRHPRHLPEPPRPGESRRHHAEPLPRRRGARGCRPARGGLPGRRGAKAVAERAGGAAEVAGHGVSRRGGPGGPGEGVPGAFQPVGRGGYQVGFAADDEDFRGTDVCRPQLCHVLALITRRRHVQPFRIQAV